MWSDSFCSYMLIFHQTQHASHTEIHLFPLVTYAYVISDYWKTLYIILDPENLYFLFKFPSVTAFCIHFFFFFWEEYAIARYAIFVFWLFVLKSLEKQPVQEGYSDSLVFPPPEVGNKYSTRKLSPWEWEVFLAPETGNLGLGRLYK